MYIDVFPQKEDNIFLCKVDIGNRSMLCRIFDSVKGKQKSFEDKYFLYIPLKH